MARRARRLPRPAARLFERESPPPYARATHFCTFVGYNRSGHTLIGSCIDAHPNALIADEMNVFEEGGITGRLVHSSREELLDEVVRKSSRQAEGGRRRGRRTPDGSDYRVSYAVPGQYQGRYTKLRVLGTKRGLATTRALSHGPGVLDRLRELTRLELKLIHVVRDPFDNIASLSAGLDRNKVGEYATLAQSVANARAAGVEMLDVHLEDVVERPQEELARVCRFLGLRPRRDYLDACASIVLARPNRTRDHRDWSPADVGSVDSLIATHPWLRRYERGAAGHASDERGPSSASATGPPGAARRAPRVPHGG